ncbi:MAG: peptidylprolyl isomerase [Phormidium sp. GEM2.Bin31]|nr:peptidylprolyl isomerase [Phormidium sp. BM_Day4_Bin.17]TVR07988.1 MAG: peptidylprolyl isomerase [Phormidium sp. GEM2.Bin31]UCJ11705.1 MAG: peptidylprolyl isomerase [Phormidium sp. PBR-2020]
MTVLKRWLKLALLVALLLPLSLGLSAAWWDGDDAGGDRQNYRQSRMPQGDAITDPKALLQYALPIENDSVRRIQEQIEDIGRQLRARKRWSAVSRDVRGAKSTLAYRRDEILEAVVPSQREAGQEYLDRIDAQIRELEAVAEVEDREEAWILRRKILNTLGELQSLMVGEFPFEIPEEYADLPQLKGRATVEMTTSQGDLTMVVDGYNAPITAGNFVDLVQRGFYDGIDFVRAEANYVLQAGDPPGPEDGFVDPETGEYRTIPLEIRVRSENDPIYGFTLEEIGLYREQPVLPFSAFGTLGMAHRDLDANSGSSQFFFFLFQPELTPAGLNLLDGRYAAFGYVVDGLDVLEKLGRGDRIESARVVDGAQYLQKGQS